MANRTPPEVANWTPPEVGGTRRTQPDAPSPIHIDLHKAKVLVTGGAGFVGHNLIKKLIHLYQAEVTVIDNLWRGKLSNLEGLIDLQTHFINADLTDPVLCRRHIREADIVFHLADVVAGVDYVFAHQPFVFRQNVLINTNVLGACVANGIQNYVYVGTACSFPQHLQMVGTGVVALHEDQTYPAEPESSYGWSKLMGEYEAALAQASGAVNVGLLRLHNVYGPGSPWQVERSQAVPSHIRKAILSPAEPFTVWGSGEQYLDFLYIDDVCDALILMAERGMNAGVVQVGTGAAVTLKEAATVVAELAAELIAGKQIAPAFDRTKPEGDRGRVAITDRAQSVLQWQPKVSFRDGLRTTFQWILQDMAAANALAAQPVVPKGIPQMNPWFDMAEADALHEYMLSDSYLTEFKQTKKFEQMLADYMGVKHCIAVNNGTVSLSLALVAVGVQAGDCVLVPDWTMVATANSVKMIGATPQFVDIDRETFCIDLTKVAELLSGERKPAAVMHVSMNARSNNIASLAELCAKYGVPLVEDSAQALGSWHRTPSGEVRHLGRFGNVGSFSFSSPKIISTGQGGALITDDDALAARIRKLKDFGRSTGGNDTHDIVGWNFKYTDMQGVVGIEQMKKLPWRVERMKQIYMLYYAELSGVGDVVMLSHQDEQPGWIPWFIDVYTSEKVALAAHLKAQKIGTRMVYPPIHKQEAYAEHNNESYPVTEEVSSRGLWLPSSSKLTDDDIKRVCVAIRQFFDTKHQSKL